MGKRNGNRPRPDLKEMRKTDAAARQEAYDKKSALEIIAELDAKYGPGKGALKVRIKLAKRRQQKEWATETPAKPPVKRAFGAVLPPRS